MEKPKYAQNQHSTKHDLPRMRKREHPNTHRRPHQMAHMPILRTRMGKPRPLQGENMTTKKQLQQELTELKQTIQDTITLLQNLIDKPDPNTIRQLDWNLGWHNGIYHLEIIEDPTYDTQALTLTIKVLQGILDTQKFI